MDAVLPTGTNDGVASIAAWLLSPDTGDLRYADLVDGLAARILAAGVPLSRISLSVQTRHPEVFVYNAIWSPELGAEVFERPRTVLNRGTFLNSPVMNVELGEGL